MLPSSLGTYLPPGFPGLARLLAFEAQLQSTPEGKAVWQNFATSLQTGLVGQDLFVQFCAQLDRLRRAARLSRDPQRKKFDEALDNPTPFHCRGPALPVTPELSLSNVLRLEALWSKRQDAPLPLMGAELTDQRLRWQADPVVATVPVAMGGVRPLFWVAPTNEVEAQAPLPPPGLMGSDAEDAARSQARRLREVLGLKHLRAGSDVFEVRVQAGALTTPHRPTILDALDYDAFRPTASPAPWLGWGRTRDLAAPDDPTRGVPEAVVPAAIPTCQIMYRGEYSS